MREYLWREKMDEKLMDLIILPFHDYKKWKNEGFRTRDSHLFQHFSDNQKINKILIVNRPVSLAERILKRRKWRTELGKVIFEKKYWQLCEVKPNVYYMDFKSNDFFKVIILRKSWWDKIFKDKKILEAINEATEILNMHNKIIFLQNPMSIGIVEKLKERMFVFDAIDNWLYHPQMKKYANILSKNYKFIKENADIIFTVSEGLKNTFDNKSNVYWIPNGVDKEKFLCDEYKEKKAKINATIGYVGKIQDRVDFELIEKCLKRYKNNKFLMIGPIYAQYNKVKYLKKNYNNIEFLGDIPYEQLPKAINQFDIAIIPHKIDEFTNSMNPLKVYEYLASGKQVVTTQVAGTDNISKYVYQSNNYDEFISFIDKAIINRKNNINIEEDVRNSLDSKYTWEKITEEIVDIIEEKM